MCQEEVVVPAGAQVRAVVVDLVALVQVVARAVGDLAVSDAVADQTLERGEGCFPVPVEVVHLPVAAVAVEAADFRSNSSHV